jgi:hypothetical protein
MKAEPVLRVEAMDVLIKTFGVVDTERFISIIKNDDFDYTEWQRNLWKDKTTDEIYAMAVKFEAAKVGKGTQA